MPLGIVTEKDFETELGNQKDSEQESVEVPIVQELPTPGRKEGDTEVPQSLRKLIGESVIEEGRPAGLAIAKFLGLSSSSVSAYSKGATSTASYHKPNDELKDHLKETRKKISKKAAGKLYKALNVIDENRLNDLTAVEASTVAKNMAVIIKQMEPEQKAPHSFVNAPQITFFVPKMSSEDRFDVIDATE